MARDAKGRLVHRLIRCAAVSADGSVDPSKVVMAFTRFAPKSAADSTRRLVRFQAKDSRHQDAVVVDVE